MGLRTIFNRTNLSYSIDRKSPILLLMHLDDRFPKMLTQPEPARNATDLGLVVNPTNKLRDLASLLEQNPLSIDYNEAQGLDGDNHPFKLITIKIADIPAPESYPGTGDNSGPPPGNENLFL